MKIIYGIIIILLIILLGACALKAKSKKGNLARIVFLYETGAVLFGITFMIFTFSNNIKVVTFCRGLMFAGYDWLLILLMYYTQYYTGLFDEVRIIKEAMVIYGMFDTVLLFSNIWTGQMFSVEFITDAELHLRFTDSIFVKIHFIYNFAIVLLLLVSYMFMIMKSSKFYRIRYEVIFASLFIAAVLDIIFFKSNSVYNISVVAFGLMSVFIYYFTLSYVPEELIENTLSLVIKDMNSGIICFDNRGKCIHCNDYIKKVFSLCDEYSELETGYHRWLEEIADKRENNIEYSAVKVVDGESKNYDVIYKRIFDDKNNFICDYFVFNDKTEDIKSIEIEKYKASHDSLTGLYNKEYFYSHVHEIVNKNSGIQYCILCSNIKDFKFINELFGLKKGDEVLVKVGEFLNKYLEDDSICARIENDRFALCMPKEKFNEKAIISRLNEFKKQFDNNAFRMHVFIGVYDIENLDEPVSIMCDKANIAGDTIKNDYHSYIAYYNNAMLENSIEERRIIGEFERALNNEEFVMYLQPQVDFKGIARGAEALVRWRHPVKGLLSPAVFVDVLEKAGLIYKIDKYMWEKAAAKLKEWKELGKEQYHISVNISTKDFYLVDVYETFVDIVERNGINPEKLKLEITETTIMDNFERNIKIIKSLQDYGFKIEIDDFGSGYSSLNMLKDISADILKIDMGFLNATENELKGQDILESIIFLAQKLGMEVITEGVETSQQLTMLIQMGCRMFQGYYFSRPVPEEEFEKKYNIRQ